MTSSCRGLSPRSDEVLGEKSDGPDRGAGGKDPQRDTVVDKETIRAHACDGARLFARNARAPVWRPFMVRSQVFERVNETAQARRRGATLVAPERGRAALY
jgi:hypothetical protein